jgi:lysophospholipase L1-like esterase
LGYEPRLVQISQAGGWRVDLSFAPPPNPRHPDLPHVYVSPPPFGLTGFRLSTDTDASMTLDAEAGAGFNQAIVCALAEPGAGSIALSAGGETQQFSLAIETRRAVCRTTRFSAPQQHLQLTATGGPVSILSWATFDDDGGVALSNLGVSGTQLKDLAERDDTVLAVELDAYRPDLIILAFGTNEGYVPHADVAAYETLLREQIARLRRLSHGTPILVLGAPDAETLRPDLYGSGGVFPDCTPLSGDEVQDYAALVQAKSPRLARWYPPAGLAEIRAAQQRASDAENAAFWDWEARMGGPCSAHRMGLEEPKLVRGDHIHYTPEGGVKIAGLLYGDLIGADGALVGAR